MANILTTAEERDQFLEWLEQKKDGSRPIGLRPPRITVGASLEEELRKVRDFEHLQGRYEAFLEVLAYVKTGGKL